MRPGVIGSFGTAESGINVDYVSNSSGSILINISEPLAAAASTAKSPMQVCACHAEVLCVHAMCVRLPYMPCPPLRRRV
jgi:hypothetical protein